MLDYEKQIFLDILQDDGLVIAAKGLGLESVIVNLLKVYCDPGNLVFVLGTDGKHQEWLVTSLIESKAKPPPRVVTSELGVIERQQAYLEGGVWFVPTRVLVVDLLKKRIPIDLITGFVVVKAHNILKNHQDSFILRLYRQGNKAGFIKAFSNHAQGFRGGFSKVEQILKALFLRTLYLWPRYHAAVKSSLSQCKPTVVEIHLEMTSKMLQLQNTLLDLIKLSVQELKRLNPLLDTEEVTVENAISETFQKVLHAQLDPVWHALSERTKSLLADLKLFHYLIMALLTHDSVSFYSLVNSQRKSDRALKGSGWHMLPPAEALFTVAKQRLHENDLGETDPEPNPKWAGLSEVLAEIHRKIAKGETVEGKREEGDEVADAVAEAVAEEKEVEAQMADMFGEGVERDAGGTGGSVHSEILILTREERTCWQLQTYLTVGSQQLLAAQYRKLFSRKIANKPDEGGDANKEGESQPTEGEEAEEDDKADTCVLSLSRFALSQLESDAKINLAGCFEDSFSQTQRAAAGDEAEASQACVDDNATTPPMITIKSFKKNVMYLAQTLQDVRPRWVVMYDSDVTIVRQLEVYQRNNPQIRLQVYFLIHGGTIEEQAYLTSLRKEKEAFDFLIEEKARVVIPEDRADCPELCRDASKANETVLKSRQGGLDSPKKVTPRIIVDMREFRSELPALIHSRGIDIEPVTITVGDYILTPDICLERKSVSDLIQSLNSGRLYNQAAAMTRHYARPMLLIEFDKDKPFDLQDRYYLSTDASSDQVVTKLQLLTLHFPQLRLVWSPSPHATAQLFEELKQGRPEPEVATAAGLGLEQTATEDDKFNPAIHSFLLKLPGVTSKNIYRLLHKGQSLDHLRKLSKEELGEILENAAEGEVLYNTFHVAHTPDESSSSSRGRGGPSRGKRKRFH